MRKVKDMLIFIRNGLAFAFAWLVICTVVVAIINGNDTIPVEFLVKLFVLCFWGVISFVVSFKNKRVEKKGFIFQLSLSYILFIPVEIVMFYFMGIFETHGNIYSWVIFGVIVILAYVIAVLVDTLIMKKDAVIYTEKMNEYVQKSKLGS